MATLSGITRDAAGATLAGATVTVFNTADNTVVATGTSDASGNFSVTTNSNGPFYIVAFKTGTPFVAGTSRRDLVTSEQAVAVQYLWTGTPTTDGVVISSKLTSYGTAASTRMVISTSSTLSNPVYTAPVTPDATYRVTKHVATGLSPNTQYHYGIEIDGVLDTTTKGQFKTLPAAGAASFKIALGSCSYNQDASSFAAIAALNPQPLFLLHMGDFHYMEIESPTTANYHAAFDVSFAVETRHSLHRKLPTVYMWDDHDFGADNTTGRDASNNAIASRSTSLNFFRSRAPVTPLSSVATDTVHYSFVVGRVRFVVTDLRSDKTANSATDNSSKTMMGAAQKAWWKAEITAAKAAGQAVAWVNTVPWHVSAVAGQDTWGSYTTERTELSDYIKAEGMAGKIFILSGDAHLMAISAGADYATGGGASIPVFQAGPLDQISSIKGGPYTYGPVPASAGTWARQYGIMEVTDVNGTLTVTWTGYTAAGVQLMTHSFSPISAPATAPSAPAAPVATAGTNSASITLVEPSNGGSPITGYTVTSIPAGGVDSAAGTTSLTRTITGLAAGTSYTFTARATNAVGTSAASSASNAVTPTAATTAFEATGGTVTTEGGYKYWTFAANDTLNVTAPGDVEYLVVAGGGGGGVGGTSCGGAGGAGGLLTGSMTISAASYAIIVGAGGEAGGPTNEGKGGNGGNSSVGALITATGGGGGGWSGSASNAGGSGGGGVGASSNTGAGAGTPGQGNDGGAGFISSTATIRASGGGGGKGAVGQAAASGVPGNGGAGVTVFGRAVAGGGGGCTGGTASQGTATHGGGAGGKGLTLATNGAANTGGGAGAYTTQNVAGASSSGATGGSGIVVIRRPV